MSITRVPQPLGFQAPNQKPELSGPEPGGCWEPFPLLAQDPEASAWKGPPGWGWPAPRSRGGAGRGSWSSRWVLPARGFPWPGAPRHNQP